MSYVDYEYYTKTYGGTIIAAKNAPKSLQIASNTIDTLTYCRIVECGLEGLTAYQRSIIQWVTCALAEWQTENEDILNSAYSGYSINGVSATWSAGAGVRQIGGIIIPASIYAELAKTGLCYRGGIR
jgi:hypothetical protein